MCPTPAMRSAPTGIRWRMLGLLTGISFVSYLERMNISVAATFMIPELGLTEVQIGWVFSSFIFGYTALQIPSGWMGDRFGVRKVFVAAIMTWGVVTVLTGVIPGVVVSGGVASLACLVVLRFMLGVAQAPTYPVSARASVNWFPPTERAFVMATVMAGSSVGSTFTAPLVSWLMVTIGWRKSFVIVSLFAFGVALLYRWYATDHPRDHHGVNPEELAIIDRARFSSEKAVEVLEVKAARAHIWQLLQNRNVLLLTTSYFFLGYIFYFFVFWLFLYLTDVRGFTMLEGGLFTALPFVAASVMAPLGGRICDRLSERLGSRTGRRLVAMLGLGLSGILLLVGANVTTPYVAIVALALCVGFGESTEGAFWASMTEITGSHSGTASAVMNMGFNLGGVVVTPLMPFLVRELGWPLALGSGALFAWLGSACWLGISPPLGGVGDER